MDNSQRENTVPIFMKYAITVEEAALLTGIGTKTLYKLINANRNAKYLLHVGDRKTLINRSVRSSEDKVLISSGLSRYDMVAFTFVLRF